jgi:hypothetical protein
VNPLPRDAHNGDVYRVVDGELFKLEAGKGPEVQPKGECAECGRCATCGKAKPETVPYSPWWLVTQPAWPTWYYNPQTTTNDLTVTNSVVPMPAMHKAGEYIVSDDSATPYPFEVSHG